jgi:hypothetical protein
VGGLAYGVVYEEINTGLIEVLVHQLEGEASIFEPDEPSPGYGRDQALASKYVMRRGRSHAANQLAAIRLKHPPDWQILSEIAAQWIVEPRAAPVLITWNVK